MDNFLHMGGYAPYVWSSYALGLAIVAWNIWAARRLLTEARERALRRLAINAAADGDSREP